MWVVGGVTGLTMGMASLARRMACLGKRVIGEVLFINIFIVFIFKQLNPFTKNMVGVLAFEKLSLKFLDFSMSNVYLLL